MSTVPTASEPTHGNIQDAQINESKYRANNEALQTVALQLARTKARSVRAKRTTAHRDATQVRKPRERTGTSHIVRSTVSKTSIRRTKSNAASKPQAAVLEHTAHSRTNPLLHIFRHSRHAIYSRETPRKATCDRHGHTVTRVESICGTEKKSKHVSPPCLAATNTLKR